MTMLIKSRIVLGIDFGTGERGSGWVAARSNATSRDLVGPHNTRVLECGMSSNSEILARLESLAEDYGTYDLILEMVQSHGRKKQGSSIHHTLLWMGRAIETYRVLFGRLPILIKRSRSAAWVAGANANDSRVIGAVSERFGSANVKGTKANPGPLYGFAHDIWQAMAVVIAYVEGCVTETYLG